VARAGECGGAAAARALRAALRCAAGYAKDCTGYSSVLEMHGRQGLSELELGDLESVASPSEGLTTTGRVNPDVVPNSFSILSEHRRLF
jgi:hypothetical protein